MHRFFTVVLAVTWVLCLFASAPVAALDTTAPVIDSVVVSPIMVSPGDAVHVKVTASDDTGVTGVTAASIALANTSTQVWEGDVPADLSLGMHSITVSAADAATNSASDSTGQYKTVPTVGISNNRTLDPVVQSVTSDYLFIIWGQATYQDADTFTVTDGGLSTCVTSPSHAVCTGDFVMAKGILDATEPPAKLIANSYKILEWPAANRMGISDVTVGKNLEVSLNGSLPQVVPNGSSLPITITSSHPDKVLLSTNATNAGSASIVVNVPGGSSVIPYFYVYGLADSGTVDVMATAQGRMSKIFHVTLARSGFVISSPGSIDTTSISANTALYVRPARLNSSLAYSSYQNLRGGLNVSVTLGSTKPTVGVVTPGTLSFTGGDSTKTTYFDPVNPGTTDITLATPQGFSTPSSNQKITATVTAPNIVGSDSVVGKDLQASSDFHLESAPSQAVSMLMTVADPAVATITTDPSVEGTDKVTITGVNDTSSKTVYIQGRSIGTTTMTVEATGYNTVTTNITVTPSGFVIASPGSFTTGTLATNTSVVVRPARLFSVTNDFSAYQNLRAGLSIVQVTVTSSNTTVGTITGSPLSFGANSSSATALFDPATAGSTNISISTPSGFSTPSSGQQITATVTSAVINASDVTVGKDLQASTTASLGSNPTAAVSMTVTVDDDSTALVSTSATVAGSKSIIIPNVVNTSAKTFYVQGLKQGTTHFTVEVDGYNPTTKTITVDPSGFAIANPTSISTTSFSPNTSVQVRTARLNPTTLVYAAYQDLRAGYGSLDVQLTSSNTAIGTITPNPVTFTGGTGSLTTNFDPVGAGTTTVSIIAPTGFSTPANYQQFTATVRNPTITAYSETVGVNLQKSTSAYLEVAPPAPVTITVTVDPNMATLTTDPALEGSGSITFNNVSDVSSKSFYVQGRSRGTTTITVSAPGYDSIQKIITIDPSGFVISSPTGISTKVTSANTSITIKPARLNPTTNAWAADQNLRGGFTAQVPVLSSNPDTGTITISPVVFNSNDSSKNTAFDPLAVGTSVISVGVPNGFTKPTTKYQINATVTQ